MGLSWLTRKNHPKAVLRGHLHKLQVCIRCFFHSTKCWAFLNDHGQYLFSFHISQKRCTLNLWQDLVFFASGPSRHYKEGEGEFANSRLYIINIAFWTTTPPFQCLFQGIQDKNNKINVEETNKSTSSTNPTIFLKSCSLQKSHHSTQTNPPKKTPLGFRFLPGLPPDPHHQPVVHRPPTTTKGQTRGGHLFPWSLCLLVPAIPQLVSWFPGGPSYRRLVLWMDDWWVQKFAPSLDHEIETWGWQNVGIVNYSWWFFTNPSEKYAQVKLGWLIFPKVRGEHETYLSCHHPVKDKYLSIQHHSTCELESSGDLNVFLREKPIPDSMPISDPEANIPSMDGLYTYIWFI